MKNARIEYFHALAIISFTLSDQNLRGTTNGSTIARIKAGVKYTKTGDLKDSMVRTSIMSSPTIGVKIRLNPAVILVGKCFIACETRCGSFFKRRSPSRHSHSDIKPIGQIQPQKPLL